MAEPCPEAVADANARRLRRRRDGTAASQLLCCTMCQSADAFQATEGRGLMQHIVRAHLGQPLLAETVAQLRALGREACRICASIRARTTPHCTHCGVATPTRPLQLGDVVPDRRRGGTQSCSRVPGTSDATATAAAAGAGAGQGGGGAATAAVASAGGEADEAPEPGSVAAVPREAHLPDPARLLAAELRKHTLQELPISTAARMGTCMAEALEGCMAGDSAWGFLAQHRSRMLLAHVPKGMDRVMELKRRLRLWEEGQFDELIRSVVGQQQSEDQARATPARQNGEERRGARAKQQAAAGAKSKAVKGLVGGLAAASPEQRQRWTEEMIPRCQRASGPRATAEEANEARACAWGGGDLRAARKDMQAAGKQPDGPPGIPWAKLAPWSAAGPTGDRQEHLDAMMRASSATQRRRLTRALDELAVRWATNQLPASCRWMLNTLVVFLRKSKTPTCKAFDDEEWLRTVQSGSWAQDVPDSDIEALGPELDAAADAPMPDAGGHEQVRPIQIGEFLRRFTSKRLLLLQRADSGRLMMAMRQVGVGIPGGAEAMAIFHQALHETWAAHQLPSAVARIKIDERNCFGLLEWDAIRAASRASLPRHYAAACWKHAEPSYVEQAGVAHSAKDRGAEQGDVDGPLECSVTLGVVAARARATVHGAQRRGDLPWTTGVLASAPITAAEAAMTTAAAEEFDQRLARTAAWEALEPAQRREQDRHQRLLTCPAHEVQSAGGLVDAWFLDDGDILVDPRLVQPYLASFDAVNPSVGAERNVAKTEVIYYATEEQLHRHASEWRLDEVRALATVRTALDPGLTLGVAVGPEGKIDEQLRQKAQVMRAMQERVAIVQDVQTEHVLNRDSLGVGRVNHILRVHGHQLAEADGALAAFDTTAKAEMARLFPGLTDESHEQASLAMKAGGLGWRRASDVARAANLSALVMARPFVRSLAAESTKAGVLPAGVLEAWLDAKTREVEESFLLTLDEADRPKATEYLALARETAERNLGLLSAGLGAAPELSVSFAQGDTDDTASRPLAELEEDHGRPRRRQLNAAHLQRELSQLADRTRLRALEATLRRQCNWAQLEELSDLRHEQMSHQWVLHLDSKRGSVLNQADYVFNIQKLLGARLQERELTCRLCGAQLDPSLVHGDCCDTAGATRGHYAVVRELVRGLKLADPSTTTEPRGLTATQARPADILTSAAVPGRSAALDVCVASPNASHAGGDAAETAFRRKLRRYRVEIPQLAAAGIAYRPVVWTTSGRPHPAATRTIHLAAAQAAHRSDGADAHALAARWCHEIQVALLRRRAAMARAVLPRPAGHEVWLLTGYSGAVPSCTHRAPALGDGDDGGCAEQLAD